MGWAYYNEIDDHAAQWLRNLIARGLIAPGEVDQRSIEDVRPDELTGFVQCHFFAGIGVWSYALRQVGWPDDRPVWTGSCPCQPFSAAGKGEGFADERHLWPAWHWLINQCRPATLLGEQVASSSADPWLDLVQADMEAMDYAFGCVPFPAASVGAPHIRDRNYWVAYATQQQWDGSRVRGTRGRIEYPDCGTVGWLEHPSRARGEVGLSEQAERQGGIAGEPDNASGQCLGAGQRPALSSLGGVADLHSDGRDQGRECQPATGHDGPVRNCATRIERPGPTNGFWRDADWLGCRDGKWRPVEPGAFPLVDGSAFRLDSGSPFEGKSRQGLLKGFGNAIVAPQATEFIRAVMGAAREQNDGQ